ncbi:MAG: hypothetical protein ABSF17_08620 [Terracidiphilus sp.]
MNQVTRFLLPGVLCLAAFSSSLHAQNEKTITIRMLDTKTGVLIATSNFLVRVNHLEEVHADWVKQNEDGTGKLTLPADAEQVSIRATYESATRIYVNCDAEKDHGSADHAASPDHWYSAKSILTSGVVAPNDCVGKKVPERLQVVAKPGEFVFFVRPQNAREQMRD